MVDLENEIFNANESNLQVRSEFHFDVKLGSLEQRKEQIEDDMRFVEDKSYEIQICLRNSKFGYVSARASRLLILCHRWRNCGPRPTTQRMVIYFFRDT